MNTKYADSLISLKNTKNNEIPKYPEALLQTALDEITSNYNEFKELNKADGTQETDNQIMFHKGKMVIKVETINRIKRFLLIMHEERIKKILSMFWSLSGDIGRGELDNLAEKERAFLLDYKELIGSYMDDVGLDLTTDLTPPIDSVVEVRVLKECGEIYEDGSVIVLAKNSVMYVRRKLVERFIERGDIIVI